MMTAAFADCLRTPRVWRRLKIGYMLKIGGRYYLHRRRRGSGFATGDESCWLRGRGLV